MNFFKQTTLIGIGLIGSSIARALKKNKLSKRIHIYSKTKKTINRAKKLNLGDFYTNNLELSVKNSDLIIICTPLSTYESVMLKIYKHIMADAILSDVGSAKLSVVRIFDKFKKTKFHILPAHPIAGTEKSGPDSGFAELFKKRWCVITPMGKNNSKSLNKLKKLWVQFGSKVEIMNAKNHDKILALTSHVPHLISYSIVSSTLKVYALEKSQIIKFSAGGLRYFTRISACDSTMWKDIFLSNKKNLLQITEKFEESLKLIKKYIRNNDSQKLKRIFLNTKKIRKLIEKEKQE